MTKIMTNLTLQVLLLSSTIVSGVVVTPNNTAVVAGTAVSYLNCSDSSRNSSAFIWNFLVFNASPAQQPIPISVSCSDPGGSYSTERPTTGSCNLIIYNASLQQAGLYSCGPAGVLPPSAQFVVLDGNPLCRTSPTGNVPVGQTVQMSCGTNVYGNMKPTMTWYNGQEEVTSYNYSNSSGYVGSTTSVTAIIPTVPSYTCRSVFSTLSTSVTADNYPTYTYQCNTSSLQVLYAPDNVSISVGGNGDPMNLPCNSQLTCSANGYPHPDYAWTVPDSPTSYESTVTVSLNGTYTCHASNTEGSISSSIVISLQPCKPTIKSSSSSTNVEAIIGGVVGGSLALAIVILGLCFFVKSCPLHQKYHSDGNSKGKEAVSNKANGAISPTQVIYEDMDHDGSTLNDGDYSKLNRGANYYENQEVHNYEVLSSPKYINIQITKNINNT